MSEYFTKSYWCAAHLKMLGVEPLRIELQNSQHRFYYTDSVELREQINQFYCNDDLQRYIDCCVATKKQMYTRRDKRRDD